MHAQFCFSGHLFPALHVDYGPETVMIPETADPVLGQVWDKRSESNVLSMHQEFFGGGGEGNSSRVNTVPG